MPVYTTNFKLNRSNNFNVLLNGTLAFRSICSIFRDHNVRNAPNEIVIIEYHSE